MLVPELVAVLKILDRILLLMLTEDVQFKVYMRIKVVPGIADFKIFELIITEEQVLV